MGASEAAILQANLSALSYDPRLVDAIRAAARDPRIEIRKARDGTPVPVLKGSGGALPMHSLYSPGREARKVYESARGCGCVVFEGLGGGCQIVPFLDDPDVAALLIVEKDAAAARSLLEAIPYERILSDPRARLVVGQEGIRRAVLSMYQPALAGAFRTLPLRPWYESERTFFDEATRQIEVALRDVQADFSVQAHFGKRWLTNMLLNLGAAENAEADLPRGEAASVAAAGPSLVRQAPVLAARRPTDILIATDTSLPSLQRLGIRPSIVLTVDCQIHGYRHFAGGRPLEAPLVLDLASPPILARIAPRHAFFASAHPFALYLRARWRRFPRLDLTGGNVTHAAVHLASALGARRIRLFGADFSYPRGAPYARGTYLFDYFEERAGRLAPSESRLFGILFRSPQVRKELLAEGIRYTTPLLSGYRDRLLTLMEALDAEVTSEPGEGLPLPVPPRLSLSTSRTTEWDQAPPKALCGWRELVRQYMAELAALPSPDARVGRYVQSLTRAQLDVLVTLLPVAANVIAGGANGRGGSSSREGGPDSASNLARGAALEESRAWVLGRAARALSL